MVDERHQQGAFRAIHALVVHARFQAWEGDAAAAANTLDAVEYLVGMLSTPGDDTDLFVDYLKDAAERLHCLRAVDEFETISAPAVVD